MQERPVYLDLTKIRLPMSAFSSITHRLAGIYVFFITLPLLLYVISESTSSKSSYEDFNRKITLHSKELFRELNLYDIDSAYSVIDKIINSN